ncbi:maleate cis-trans isomerase family protein [Cryobacterium aureum]|uniref:maleate cis-trans isomerase family protein n=1 Tax=Cryobacterium aureum TaxID=995037 RepID=UPI00137515BE|nr:hypothetical protein [Cryobacterium aureum]
MDLPRANAGEIFRPPTPVSLSPGVAPGDRPPTAGPLRQRGIGVICPFDMALDRELWRWMPPEVSLFFTRTVFVDEPVSVELALEVSDTADILAAALNLSGVSPEVMAYACTSGSFVNGVAGSDRISAAMERGGAPRGITTSGALVDALDYLGVQRLVVVTPYVADLASLLDRYLAETGRLVVAQSSLGLGENIWQVPYATTIELIRGADVPEAEAIFVSCTNLPTYDILAPLELELGKPIISANQVTAWAALRALGLAAVGPGQRLLA